MMLTLFVIGGLLLLSVVANTALSDLEKKIDISVYFLPGVDEGKILQIKKEVASVPEVKSVIYVSREEALAAFKERHKGDAVIASALEELAQDNPLGATLNIKARSPRELASIAAFVQSKKYPDVDKVNYFENEGVIERLSAVVSSVRSIGFLMVLVLSFVAILVAFNTARLAIYTSREEIGIMQLVGASSWFVRGPFLITGVIHGGFSSLFTSLLFLPIVWLASPRVAFLLPQVDLFGYFVANFFEFLLIMAVIGITLGVFSSAIAIRKYLQI